MIKEHRDALLELRTWAQKHKGIITGLSDGRLEIYVGESPRTVFKTYGISPDFYSGTQSIYVDLVNGESADK